MKIQLTTVAQTDAREDATSSQTAHMWLPVFILAHSRHNYMDSSNYHDSPDTVDLKVK